VYLGGVYKVSKRKLLENMEIHEFGSFIFSARDHTRPHLSFEDRGTRAVPTPTTTQTKIARRSESLGSFMRNSKETARLLGYLGLRKDGKIQCKSIEAGRGAP